MLYINQLRHSDCVSISFNVIATDLYLSCFFICHTFYSVDIIHQNAQVALSYFFWRAIFVRCFFVDTNRTCFLYIASYVVKSKRE